jgi:hypothetical protein
MSFVDKFEEAWEESMSNIGRLLGGCLPWLLVTIVVVILVAMIGAAMSS